MRSILAVVIVLLSFSWAGAEEASPQMAREEPVACGTNSGWFVGSGFGSAEVEVIGHDRSSQVAKNLSKLGLNVQSAMGSEDDNATLLTLRGGYRFCPYVAVEAAWHDLGETEGSFTATVLNPGAVPISGTLDSDYWAVSISALGRYPFFPWLGVYAKAGLHYWDHEMDIVGQGVGVSVDMTDKSDGTDILYGFGVECGPVTDIAVLRNSSLRVEWERFYGIEDEDGIDSTTLLLQYNF
jgi:hypothetical protein